MNKVLTPAAIIQKFYKDSPTAHKILLSHSRKVTKKSLEIGRRLLANGDTINIKFLAEAAMLHDIGMIMTNTPELGCRGSGPYLQHGIKGKELLLDEGLPDHAEVCERHIGVGLSADEIRVQQLPLPARDMQPQTLEQQIICYADLFFSKNQKKRDIEQTPDEIKRKLRQFGKEKAEIFDQWHERFKIR
jgi:uncharacterized protein